jgi:hypothetical protein
VAHPAGLDFDTHGLRAGCRDFSLDELERAVGAGYLHRTHFRHISSVCIPQMPAAALLFDQYMTWRAVAARLQRARFTLILPWPR